ncbi:MAG: four helix bundle protein [Steroidobacteraceae bacterium]
MRDYRRLEVYRCAEQLVIDTYRCTASMALEERYRLRAQMRAAAVSIASNIAEGSARTTDLDFARFIEIALGSARELECQLTLAEKLGVLMANPRDASARCDRTSRMLTTLLRALRKPGARSCP